MSASTTLKKIGLGEKEITLYMALLRRGKMKPSELATLTKINRATVYSIVKGLTSKGLVAEDVSGRTTYITPLPPESLAHLADDARREMREKEELIKRAVGELSLMKAEHAYPVPKMRIVEEGDLEKFLHDNTTKWQDAIIAGDGIWWGFQDKSFTERYQKWIDFTWTTQQSEHQNYLPKVFTNISPTEVRIAQKYKKDRRVVKMLTDVDLTANTWVCGDYMVMIVTDQHPSYLIEIHDKMLAHNTKEIFKKLWSVM